MDELLAPIFTPSQHVLDESPCELCKEVGRCTTRTEPDNPAAMPNVLGLLLDRFASEEVDNSAGAMAVTTEYTAQKLMTSVPLQQGIVCNAVPYTLCAVISHKGSTLDSGHYVTAIKKSRRPPDADDDDMSYYLADDAMAVQTVTLVSCFHTPTLFLDSFLSFQCDVSLGFRNPLL